MIRSMVLDSEIPTPSDNGETRELQRCLTSIKASMDVLKILQTELNVIHELKRLIQELYRFYQNNPQGLIRKGWEKVQYKDDFIAAQQMLKEHFFSNHKPINREQLKHHSKLLDAMFDAFSRDALALETETQQFARNDDD